MSLTINLLGVTIISRVLMDGEQHRYLFPNGYGASVVRYFGSYGFDEGLWELAVTDHAGNLDYSTEITDDVLGYLSDDEVSETLGKIAALPPRNL